MMDRRREEGMEGVMDRWKKRWIKRWREVRMD